MKTDNWNVTHYQVGRESVRENLTKLIQGMDDETLGHMLWSGTRGNDGGSLNFQIVDEPVDDADLNKLVDRVVAERLTYFK